MQGVLAKGNDRTIGFETKRMIAAGSNHNHTAQTGRNIRLTENIDPPRNDGAVASKCYAMSETSRNSYNVAKASGRVGLAKPVVAPANNGAIALESQAVLRASRDGNDPRQTRWNIRLTRLAIPPNGYFPAESQSHDKCISRTNGNRVACAWGNSRDRRATPGNQLTIGQEANPGRCGVPIANSDRHSVG